MDRLRTLRVFIAVADHASFAEAARRLGLSPATVSRTVAALEAGMGVALLRRTTRSVRLTDEGAAFLDRARAGLAEIDAAFDVALGRSAPHGTLTVTAPVMFGRRHILPIVVEMLRLHPDLRVRLLLLDRIVRLVEEGIDVAVRIADLPDSALHARKVGTVRPVISASPAYLREHGEPATRAELRHHRLIAVEDEVGPHRDRDATRSGRLRLSVNSIAAAIDAAVAGLGIVRSLSYQVNAHLAAGRLRQLLVDDPAPPLPVSLLFQAGGADRANVRAFVDLARDRLVGAAL